MKLSISEKRMLLFLLIIMPFVDSLNGIIMNTVNIGQFYRIFTFFYFACIYIKYKGKKAVNFLITFAVWIIVQYAVGISYGSENIQITIKLFLPMLIILVMNTMQKQGKLQDTDIYHIFDVWSFIYPITIIVPFMLGTGTYAYDGTTGTKGYYYALNEISFIICAIIMYLVVKINYKLRLKTIVLLLLNCITIILMGTKSGYATLVLFIIIYFLYNGHRRKHHLQLNNGKRKMIILIFIVVATVVGYRIFKEQLMQINERWMWQLNHVSTSAIDFLTSSRIRRISNGFDLFLNGKPWYLFLGWGLGGEYGGMPNMEMDFLDLLFRTGIIGFAYIVLFYLLYWKKNVKKNYWSNWILIWAIGISFGVGHVIFYGQSGMVFALLFVFCSFYNASNAMPAI